MDSITFGAWRGRHYIGLSEIVAALGSIVADLQWDLRFDEVAPGPEGEALEGLVTGRRVTTLQLLEAAFPNGQVIDGELRGHLPDQQGPALIIRAIDSTEWDITWTDVRMKDVILAAFSNDLDSDS